MKEILNSFEYLPMLSEFVKVCDTKNAINDTPITLMEFICQYTNFITQPLTKGMFVPCDEEGNVLEEPLRSPRSIDEAESMIAEIEEFQQAKERVLFDNEERYKDSSFDTFGYGLYMHRKTGWFYSYALADDFYKFTTIEDAINAGVKLKLKG